MRDWKVKRRFFEKLERDAEHLAVIAEMKAKAGTGDEKPDTDVPLRGGYTGEHTDNRGTKFDPPNQSNTLEMPHLNRN